MIRYAKRLLEEILDGAGTDKALTLRQAEYRIREALVFCDKFEADWKHLNARCKYLKNALQEIADRSPEHTSGMFAHAIIGRDDTDARSEP